MTGGGGDKCAEPRDCPTKSRSSPCRNVLQNCLFVFCPSRSKPCSIATGRNLSQGTAEILMMSIATTPGRIIAALALLTASTLPSGAQERGRGVYTPPPLGTVHATVAEHGMVVAQEKIAARVGADILRQGGNAVDAAVATGFAMAVTYPRAGNIGGGGFMVIHLADRNEDIAIDYREAAPAATTRDIFLGADGKPDSAKSRDTAFSIGVPGTVAGMTLALEKYGSGRFTLAPRAKPATGVPPAGCAP